MGWSNNDKAEAKRDKEKGKKQQKEKQREEIVENKKWKDEESDKKFKGQKDKEDKREKELAQKRELKELADQEERELEMGKKKKDTFAKKKLTQAEIAVNNRQREKKQNEGKNQEEVDAFEQGNPNLSASQYEVVKTVEEALRVLDVDEEKHPEKRFRAAFETYSEARESSLKSEFPKMKRSQRQQMMRKEFEKDPENPFNKKLVAFNDKSKKQAKKAEEKEKENEKEKSEKVEQAGSQEDN